MDLSCLIELVKDMPGYQYLKQTISETGLGGSKIVLPNAVRPYIIASLHHKLALPVLVITAHQEHAKILFDQFQPWYSDCSSVKLFPELEIYSENSFVTDSDILTERLRTLSYLCHDAHSDSLKPLVVCSAVAAASRTMPFSNFFASCHTVEKGDMVDPLWLVRQWRDLGYKLDDLVEVPGMISRRGGILDIFSPNNEFPARIEFFGNRVDNIRFFDPKTQRSSAFTPSIKIVPAKEQLQSSTDTIFDYMPDEALLIIDDYDSLKSSIIKIDKETNESLRIEKGSDKQTGGLCLCWPEFKGRIGKMRQRLTLYSWNLDASGDTSFCCSLPVSSVLSYGGRLDSFSQALKYMLGENRRVVIVSQQTKRLAEVLQEQDILSNMVYELEQIPPMGSINLIQGSITEGWELKDVLTLLTDKEIFGVVKERRLSRRRPVRHHLFVSELTSGDYVVHIEHGIAKFIGLTKMPAESVEKEYLVLEYAAGDRLYVPTDQIDRVSRYVGSGEQLPMLSRLGTQEWAKVKQRVKESVAKVARDLLDLYATREVIQGFAFSQDNLWQQELEASFVYTETPDQLEAVKAVKADMEKPRPMDRLVCGDVGYGKTEVALRAAFKAVMDNKQVALLVPTTILAQQHFATFCARLKAFPIKLAMLSRFCTEQEQSKIIEGIAAGTVDICIGTHRLLQRDIKFKDIGLIIIDEEQRFGVKHKEHFKRLRREVDILTLSATPIPRTLHMSLVGIRDMSVMETPPEDRLPITTYVGAYSDNLVREAILRELERNGQVFFVHNQVQSILLVANRLRSLVPEARISIAHGQMSENELEEVIEEFTSGSSDVLVTTTIIESGLDMPNVNTLIVDNADKLGLTQLYQLRGRIGRGDNHAYALFLFEGGKQLTPEAGKRLATIAEATDLGAGFGIAMRDLEIRGAGNLLGIEQSGYIVAVGFDLYSRLLSEAVEDVRRERAGDPKKESLPTIYPSIALPLAAHIPGEYIANQDTRIAFYQRLAAVQCFNEISDLAREMIDRFGAMPRPLENLFYTLEIRWLAAKAMIESVSTEGRYLVLHLRNATEFDMVSFQEYSAAIYVGNRRIRLDIETLGDSWQKALKEVIQKVSRK